jgi:hypothetical protein
VEFVPVKVSVPSPFSMDHAVACDGVEVRVFTRDIEDQLGVVLDVRGQRSIRAVGPDLERAVLAENDRSISPLDSVPATIKVPLPVIERLAVPLPPTTNCDEPWELMENAWICGPPPATVITPPVMLAVPFVPLAEARKTLPAVTLPEVRFSVPLPRIHCSRGGQNPRRRG